MTRRERRVLVAGAILLSLACSLLFARAVLAHRAADLARAQARAALLPAREAPASDVTQRAMLDWSGASAQMRFWQALQRFRLVSAPARSAMHDTLPPLTLLFRLDQTAALLRQTAAAEPSRQRRSRLEEMVGLTYYYDSVLHRGEIPIGPQLARKAVVAFQRAVWLDGSNTAAKTNLELLLRNQLRRQRQKVGHPKPLPDQTRAEGATESASGFPSINGARGRRVTGGY